MPRTADGITEFQTTRWHNPTPHKQRVIIHSDGRGEKPVAISWEPGETKEVSSKYDRGIHAVDCGRDDCHRRGWFCTQGHPGVIQGGGAPLLRRVGAEDQLDPALDPNLAEKKSAEAALVAQEMVRRAASEGMITALASEQAASERIAAAKAAEAKLEAATKPDEKPAQATSRK